MVEMNQENESTNEFKTLTAYELTECIREYQESFLAGVPSIDEFKKVVEAIGDKQNEVREFLEHKYNPDYAKPLLEVFNSILKCYEKIKDLPEGTTLTWDLIFSNVEPKNGLYEKIKSEDDSYINEEKLKINNNQQTQKQENDKNKDIPFLGKVANKVCYNKYAIAVGGLGVLILTKVAYDNWNRKSSEGGVEKISYNYRDYKKNFGDLLNFQDN